MNSQPVRYDLLHQMWEMLGAIQNDPVALAHFSIDRYMGQDAVVRDNDLEFQRFITPKELAATFEGATELNHCGTIGCAMGFGRLVIPGLSEAVTEGRTRSCMWDPVRMANGLGVKEREIAWMFLGDHYSLKDPVTPAMVAGRVAAVIDSYSIAGAA